MGVLMEVRAVWSINVGCLLCLLVYLAVARLRTVTRKSMPDLKLTHDSQTSSFPSLAALVLHHESGDMVSVFLVLTWLKFLSMSSKEHLREEGMLTPQMSPLRMLKMLTFLFVLFVGVITAAYFAHLPSSLPQPSPY
ncbi:uncharacterized protein LOC127001847 [Eriocheir sinensis]|uniref:uncharacterized protein LOC127001847 n=1 Tax=Eriocheir sinensis TaxID=95602 RepID=UPI0021C84993|nr:uncharacterized protein LOC127001847 [Eriocheir sinensis]